MARCEGLFRVKVLDLFSGIGGFSLGLERAGMRTIAFCEIEEYPRRVLRKHWPDVPIFEDVRELRREDLPERPDVIAGGYPCQPFSRAARGRNNAPDLWPVMRSVVYDIRPKWVIAENVEEITIERAARDLQVFGYQPWKRRIGADDCGADHSRSRWWLCAYADGDRKFHSAIDAEVAKLPEVCSGVWGWPNYAAALRVPHGIPCRMDRLRALGNAVVPQIPEMIGRAIMAVEAA